MGQEEGKRKKEREEDATILGEDQNATVEQAWSQRNWEMLAIIP